MSERSEKPEKRPGKTRTTQDTAPTPEAPYFLSGKRVCGWCGKTHIGLKCKEAAGGPDQS